MRLPLAVAFASLAIPALSASAQDINSGKVAIDARSVSAHGKPSVAPRRVARLDANGNAAGHGIGGAYQELVAKHAAANGVPVSLVHRVIMRESRYNPRAVSRGNYGIMQIRLGTARALGYTGTAQGLLDADTNMTYAVRYLAGAYKVAGGNHDRAVGLYARGYYYDAKRRGLNAYALSKPAAEASAPVAALRQEASAEPMSGQDRDDAAAAAAPADRLTSH